MVELLQRGESDFELKPHATQQRRNTDDSSNFKKSNPGARFNLDPSIFGEHPAKSEFSRTETGARMQLDPAIFGQKPERTQVTAPPAAELDLSKAKDCTDYNQDQTLSLVARLASSKFRSMRDCFGSWRTTNDRLSWEDIYRGMVNDGKVEVSPEVLEVIVQDYGGELTVGGLTRMVSDGVRLNAPEPVREAPAALTERDILLNKVAKGLKGKEWEPVVKGSKNALDLTRNLKKFGVEMKSDELRATFEQLGIKKICDEIKARQAPPKKRRG
jgi:hypothetical protein